MKILKHVENLRSIAFERGDYRDVADEAGVTYHWLQKFARGGIKNPTVSNIAKLENYFMPIDTGNQPPAA